VLHLKPCNHSFKLQAQVVRRPQLLLPLLIRLCRLEQQLQQQHSERQQQMQPMLQTIKQLLLGDLPGYLFEELKRQMWARLDDSISTSTGSTPAGSTDTGAHGARHMVHIRNAGTVSRQIRPEDASGAAKVRPSQHWCCNIVGL
jgi:hypothetical protein